MSSQIDKKLLKTLEPLSQLTPDKLDELAQKSRIEKLPADRILFRQGDRNNRLQYILSGQIELSIQGQKKTQLIKGKTDQARYPLAEDLPRPCTAKTRTESMFLSIDQDLLEILSSDISQQDAIEVTDLSGEHDINSWMLRFLQSPAFLQLPTENIQTLLMKLEEVSFKKNQVIVKQGDQSDYYYIVQKGRCGVSRRPAPNVEDVKLAILSNGDGFGEEALITGSRRNATITMLEDGNLMRLQKEDFLELLIKPLINYYNEQEVIKNLSQGSLVIDVRPHEAFMENHIEGSINIPLSMLRAKLSGLNTQRDYIVCCEDGTQSEAAAFLLIQQGLKCHVLKNGFKSTNIVTAAPMDVEVSQAETTKTRQADENKNLAEAKAIRLKQETEKARKEAEELARKAKAAEDAKAAAQLELKRLKEKELAQKDSALQSARQQIGYEAQRAKKAEEELQRLLNEKNKNAEHQAALQKSLSQAEKVAQESARIAAEAHKQAERDAEKIRKQAEKEASKLRAEMDAERRRHEQAIEQARIEEEQKHNQAIEEARRKAREAVKITAAEAKTEAAAIRQQAVEEAEALRAKVEETRSQIEKSIADAESKGELQRQMLLEEAQREAERVAHNTTQQAELEAEQIRLKALAEAEKLRAEMEEAKKLVEQEAEKIRLRNQREIDEAARKKAETEKAQRDLQHQQANKAKQHQQKLAQQADEKKQAEARQRAEAIKARLESVAKEKEKQETFHAGGLSVAGFKIKETKDRIILESDEDIFIFKMPKITNIDKEKLLNEVANTKSSPKDDLPSFEVHSEEPMIPKKEPQFIGTMAIDSILENKHSAKPAKQKNTFAIAALMVMGIGLGGLAYIKMDSADFSSQTALTTSTNKTTAGLLNNSSSANNLAKAEKKVNQKAEEEFDSLLSKWKKSVARQNEQ